MSETEVINTKMKLLKNYIPILEKMIHKIECNPNDKGNSLSKLRSLLNFLNNTSKTHSLNMVEKMEKFLKNMCKKTDVKKMGNRKQDIETSHVKLVEDNNEMVNDNKKVNEMKNRNYSTDIDHVVESTKLKKMASQNSKDFNISKKRHTELFGDDEDPLKSVKNASKCNSIPLITDSLSHCTLSKQKIQCNLNDQASTSIVDKTMQQKLADRNQSDKTQSSNQNKSASRLTNAPGHQLVEKHKSSELHQLVEIQKSNNGHKSVELNSTAEGIKFDESHQSVTVNHFTEKQQYPEKHNYIQRQKQSIDRHQSTERNIISDRHQSSKHHQSVNEVQSTQKHKPFINSESTINDKLLESKKNISEYKHLPFCSTSSKLCSVTNAQAPSSFNIISDSKNPVEIVKPFDTPVATYPHSIKSDNLEEDEGDDSASFSPTSQNSPPLLISHERKSDSEKLPSARVNMDCIRKALAFINTQDKSSKKVMVANTIVYRYEDFVGPTSTSKSDTYDQIWETKSSESFAKIIEKDPKQSSIVSKSSLSNPSAGDKPKVDAKISLQHNLNSISNKSKHSDSDQFNIHGTLINRERENKNEITKAEAARQRASSDTDQLIKLGQKGQKGVAASQLESYKIKKDTKITKVKQQSQQEKMSEGLSILDKLLPKSKCSDKIILSNDIVEGKKSASISEILPDHRKDSTHSHHLSDSVPNDQLSTATRFDPRLKSSVPASDKNYKSKDPRLIKGCPQAPLPQIKDPRIGNSSTVKDPRLKETSTMATSSTHPNYSTNTGLAHYPGSTHIGGLPLRPLGQRYPVSGYGGGPPCYRGRGYWNSSMNYQSNLNYRGPTTLSNARIPMQQGRCHAAAQRSVAPLQQSFIHNPSKHPPPNIQRSASNFTSQSVTNSAIGSSFTCLMLQNLPHYTDSSHIYMLFEEYILRDICIELDNSYRCKGIAYVQFPCHDSAKEALERVHNSFIGGYSIALKICSVGILKGAKYIHDLQNHDREQYLNIPIRPKGNGNPYYKPRPKEQPIETNDSSLQELSMDPKNEIAQPIKPDDHKSSKPGYSKLCGVKVDQSGTKKLIDFKIPRIKKPVIRELEQKSSTKPPSRIKSPVQNQETNEELEGNTNSNKSLKKKNRRHGKMMRLIIESDSDSDTSVNKEKEGNVDTMHSNTISGKLSKPESREISCDEDDLPNLEYLSSGEDDKTLSLKETEISNSSIKNILHNSSSDESNNVQISNEIFSKESNYSAIIKKHSDDIKNFKKRSRKKRKRILLKKVEGTKRTRQKLHTIKKKVLTKAKLKVSIPSPLRIIFDLSKEDIMLLGTKKGRKTSEMNSNPPKLSSIMNEDAVYSKCKSPDNQEVKLQNIPAQPIQKNFKRKLIGPVVVNKSKKSKRLKAVWHKGYRKCLYYSTKRPLSLLDVEREEAKRRKWDSNSFSTCSNFNSFPLNFKELVDNNVDDFSESSDDKLNQLPLLNILETDDEDEVSINVGHILETLNEELKNNNEINISVDKESNETDIHSLSLIKNVTDSNDSCSNFKRQEKSADMDTGHPKEIHSNIKEFDGDVETENPIYSHLYTEAEPLNEILTMNKTKLDVKSVLNICSTKKIDDENVSVFSKALLNSDKSKSGNSERIIHDTMIDSDNDTISIIASDIFVTSEVKDVKRKEEIESVRRQVKGSVITKVDNIMDDIKSFELKKCDIKDVENSNKTSPIDVIVTTNVVNDVIESSAEKNLHIIPEAEVVARDKISKLGAVIAINRDKDEIPRMDLKNSAAITDVKSTGTDMDHTITTNIMKTAVPTTSMSETVKMTGLVDADVNNTIMACEEYGAVSTNEVKNMIIRKKVDDVPSMYHKDKMHVVVHAVSASEVKETITMIEVENTKEMRLKDSIVKSKLTHNIVKGTVKDIILNELKDTNENRDISITEILPKSGRRSKQGSLIDRRRITRGTLVIPMTENILWNDGGFVDLFQCDQCDYVGKLCVHHLINYHPDREVPCQFRKEDFNPVLRDSKGPMYPDSVNAVRLNLDRLPKKMIFDKEMECYFENDCDYISSNRFDFIYHLLEHLPEALSTMYHCRLCNFMADELDKFYDHFASHTGEYRHKCDRCGQKCFSIDSLELHHVDYHGQQSKQFTCEDMILENGFPYIYTCKLCLSPQIKKENTEKHVRRRHNGRAEIVKSNMSRHVFITTERKRDTDAAKQLKSVNFIKTASILTKTKKVSKLKRRSATYNKKGKKKIMNAKESNTSIIDHVESDSILKSSIQNADISSSDEVSFRESTSVSLLPVNENTAKRSVEITSEQVSEIYEESKSNSPVKEIIASADGELMLNHTIKDLFQSDEHFSNNDSSNLTDNELIKSTDLLSETDKESMVSKLEDQQNEQVEESIDRMAKVNVFLGHLDQQSNNPKTENVNDMVDRILLNNYTSRSPMDIKRKISSVDKILQKVVTADIDATEEHYSPTVTSNSNSSLDLNLSLLKNKPKLSILPLSFDQPSIQNIRKECFSDPVVASNQLHSLIGRLKTSITDSFSNISSPSLQHCPALTRSSNQENIDIKIELHELDSSQTSKLVSVDDKSLPLLRIRPSHELLRNYIEADKNPSGPLLNCQEPNCNFKDVTFHKISHHCYIDHQKFSCFYCPFLTSCVNAYDSHILTTHKIYRFKCPRSCYNELYSSSQFLKHNALVHKIDPMSPPGLAEQVVDCQEPTPTAEDCDFLKIQSFCTMDPASASQIFSTEDVTKKSILEIKKENEIYHPHQLDDVPADPPTIPLQNIFTKYQTLDIFKLYISSKVYSVFKCVTRGCSYTTQLPKEFLKHLKNDHNLLNQEFRCCYCLLCFTIEEDLVKHVLTEHSHCEYMCKYCLYRAYSKVYVGCHVKKFHPDLTARYVIVGTINKEAPSNLSIDYFVYPYKCSFNDCNFRTVDSEVFVNHVESHDGRPDMVCYFCEFTSPVLQLIQHMHIHQMNEFQCPYCLYGESEREKLLTHLLNVHPGRTGKVLLRKQVSSSSTVLASTVKDLPLSIKYQHHSNCDEQSTHVDKSSLNEKFSSLDEEDCFLKDQHPSMNINETSVIKDEPSVTKDEPSITKDDPSVTKDELPATKGEPALSKEKPSFSKDQSCILNSSQTMHDLMFQPPSNMSPAMRTYFSQKLSPSSVLPGTSTAISAISCELEKFGLIGMELYCCGNEKCSFSCSTASFLKEHLQICDFSRDSPLLKCYHCSKNFRHLNGLMDHMKLHGPKRYICGIAKCTYRACLPSSFKYHMKQDHHISAYRAVPKDLTNKNPETQEFMVYSKDAQPTIREPHKKRKNEFATEDADKIPLAHVSYQDLKCYHCLYATKIRLNLIKHLRLHETRPLGTPNSDFILPNFVIGQNNQIPYKVPINPVPRLDGKELMFDKMKNLAGSSVDNKNIVEENALRAQFPIPQEEFNNLPQYILDEKVNCCGISGCKYMSCDVVMLKYHIETLHSDVATFCCPHCSNYLLTAESFANHYKYHGEKLYRCGWCNHLSVRLALIERHLKDEHPLKQPFFFTIRGTETRENEDVDGYREPQESRRLDVNLSKKRPILHQDSSQHEKEVDMTGTNQDLKWGCCLCSCFRVSTEAEIINHMNIKHDTNCQYKCGFCNFKSSNQSVFKGHHAAKHIGKKELTVHCLYFQIGSEDIVPIPQGGNTSSHEPIWKRNDPNRIHQIRGILIDDVNHEEVCLLDIGPGEPVKDEFVCPKCHSFKNSCSITFRSHLCKESNYQRFECKECETTSPLLPSLRRHYTKIHGLTFSVECYNTLPVDNTLEEWMESIISHQENLIKEWKTTAAIQLKTSSPSKQTARRSSSGGKNQTFGLVNISSETSPVNTKCICPSCGLECKSSVGLKIHINSQHPTVHKCPSCSFFGSCETALKAHILSHHSREGRGKLKCPHCDFKTNTNKRLSNHRQLIHPELRTFICLYCNNRYESASSGARHHTAKHSDQPSKIVYRPIERAPTNVNENLPQSKSADEIDVSLSTVEVSSTLQTKKESIDVKPSLAVISLQPKKENVKIERLPVVAEVSHLPKSEMKLSYSCCHCSNTGEFSFMEEHMKTEHRDLPFITRKLDICGKRYIEQYVYQCSHCTHQSFGLMEAMNHWMNTHVTLDFKFTLLLISSNLIPQPVKEEDEASSSFSEQNLSCTQSTEVKTDIEHNEVSSSTSDPLQKEKHEKIRFSSIEEHSKVVGKGKVQCGHCSYEGTMQSLRNHFTVYHPSILLTTRKLPRASRSADYISSFRCDICNHIVKIRKSIRYHMVKLHPDNQESFTRLHLGMPLPPLNSPPLICKHCSELVDNPQNHHLMQHSSLEPVFSSGESSRAAVITIESSPEAATTPQTMGKIKNTARKSFGGLSAQVPVKKKQIATKSTSGRLQLAAYIRRSSSPIHSESGAAASLEPPRTPTSESRMPSSQFHTPIAEGHGTSVSDIDSYTTETYSPSSACESFSSAIERFSPISEPSPTPTTSQSSRDIEERKEKRDGVLLSPDNRNIYTSYTLLGGQPIRLSVPQLSNLINLDPKVKL